MQTQLKKQFKNIIFKVRDNHTIKIKTEQVLNFCNATFVFFNTYTYAKILTPQYFV